MVLGSRCFSPRILPSRSERPQHLRLPSPWGCSHEEDGDTRLGVSVCGAGSPSPAAALGLVLPADEPRLWAHSWASRAEGHR